MTANPEREITLTSFCASCGKPCRWCTAPNDKRRNNEFCGDCEPYMAQIAQIDMAIAKLDSRASSSNAAEQSATIQIDKLYEDRDIRVRILETIRIGVINDFLSITEKNKYYSLGKLAKN